MIKDNLGFRLRYVYSCGLVFQSSKQSGITNCRFVLDLLLALLFPLILRVLQHLLLPQVKEVRRICIELEGFLVIIPI